MSVDDKLGHVPKRGLEEIKGGKHPWKTPINIIILSLSSSLSPKEQTQTQNVYTDWFERFLDFTVQCKGPLNFKCSSMSKCSNVGLYKYPQSIISRNFASPTEMLVPSFLRWLLHIPTNGTHHWKCMCILMISMSKGATYLRTYISKLIIKTVDNSWISLVANVGFN